MNWTYALAITIAHALVVLLAWTLFWWFYFRGDPE